MNALSDQDIVHLWFEHCYATSTREAYKAEWRRWERFCQSHQLSCALNEITPTAISNFVKSRNLGESSKRRVIIIFRSLYAFAKRCGFTGISPAHLLRCPRAAPIMTERILSDENLEKMLLYANSRRDELIVRFLYNSGARVAEAAKVNVQDITPRDDGSSVVKLHGKGDRIRRVVLNIGFTAHLKRYISTMPTTSRLFLGQRGPLSAAGIRQAVKAIVKRAKLNKSISPHYLRHFFANTALNNGAKIHHVSHALGHKSLHTTSTYTHGTQLTSEAPSTFLTKTMLRNELLRARMCPLPPPLPAVFPEF